MATRVPCRMHGGDLTVAGITRTTNLGFLSTDKQEYPGWYQRLMELVRGSNLDRMYAKAMNYQRYGLLYEDLLVETPDVRAALLRLPKDVLSDRDDRIKQALVLHAAGDQLPRDQWTNEETDQPYLAPYLAQVVQERRDREAFRPR